MEKANIGIIGLAVMGANLARNISRNFNVVVYNRTTEKMEQFIKEFDNEKLAGEATLEEFVKKLELPRKIILMVKSGDPVDSIINQLLPLLEPDDIVIDGGNSNYHDTNKRQKHLSHRGIHFIGMGISGGEEGALNGPSMMPGGEKDSFETLLPILEKSAAEDGLGGKCVDYIGPGASGHFVKMVHNGIEYGIMQLIAESYDILKNIGGFTNEELAETFAEWSQTENLKSFLIEITAKIFTKKDEETGKDLIDLIKDAAKQKGTGKWTTFAAMDYGSATPTINTAVDSRIISGAAISRNTGKNFPKALDSSIKTPDKATLKEIVKNALTMSSIITYYQGFDLIHTASHEQQWELDLSNIARIWRGGCIIRSDFLDKLQRIFYMGRDTSKISETKMKKLELLNTFNGKPQLDWRKMIILGTANAIPVPATSSALSYYDALRAKRLPQNLTQAQRDLFGAHTYERIDKKGNFHTEW